MAINKDTFSALVPEANGEAQEKFASPARDKFLGKLLVTRAAQFVVAPAMFAGAAYAASKGNAEAAMGLMAGGAAAAGGGVAAEAVISHNYYSQPAELTPAEQAVEAQAAQGQEPPLPPDYKPIGTL